MKFRNLLLLAALTAGTAVAQSVVDAPELELVRPVPSKSRAVKLNLNKSEQRKAIERQKLTGKQSVAQRPVQFKVSRPAEDATYVQDFEWATGIYTSEKYTALPEGWSRKSESGEGLTDDQHWFAGYTGDLLTSPQWPDFAMETCDGYYSLGIMYSNNVPQDEWVISQSITPVEGDFFNFYYHVNSLWLFQLAPNMKDYKNGYQEVSATLQAYISEDNGATWTKLWDAVDQFKDMPFEELHQYYRSQPTWDFLSVDLSAYVGKPIKFAFRYVGQGGDTANVDLISIGKPYQRDLTGTSYKMPEGTLFLGVSNDFCELSSDIAFNPIFVPLTYKNTSSHPDGVKADYTWLYHIPASNYADEAYTQDLTLTYLPYEFDYQGLGVTRSYEYFPSLTSHAEGFNDETFNAPHTYGISGGAPNYYAINWRTGQKEVQHMGAYPFSKKEGMEMLNMGQDQLPLVGYNEESDDYWDAVIREQYGNHGEYEITGFLGGIFNHFPAPKQDLVINSTWLCAYGDIDDNVRFDAYVYTLEGEYQEFSDEPVAISSIMGRDIKKFDDGYYYKNLILPFTFLEPLVIPAGTEYVIVIRGFHAPGVTYFAPYQTAQDAPDGICRGYYELYLKTAQGEQVFAHPLSTWETLEGTGCLNSFFIGLDAEYPWLYVIGDEENPYEGDNTFDAEKDGDIRVFDLCSYYDADMLTVTGDAVGGGIPSWLKVSLTGRMNETKLRVQALSVEEGKKNTCTLTVSGPGVKQDFKITQSSRGTSAIQLVETEDNASKVAFDLAGRKVKTDNLRGIYVKDGKKIVK